MGIFKKEEAAKRLRESADELRRFNQQARTIDAFRFCAGAKNYPETLRDVREVLGTFLESLEESRRSWAFKPFSFDNALESELFAQMIRAALPEKQVKARMSVDELVEHSAASGESLIRLTMEHYHVGQECREVALFEEVRDRLAADVFIASRVRRLREAQKALECGWPRDNEEFDDVAEILGSIDYDMIEIIELFGATSDPNGPEPPLFEIQATVVARFEAVRGCLALQSVSAH